MSDNIKPREQRQKKKKTTDLFGIRQGRYHSGRVGCGCFSARTELQQPKQNEGLAVVGREPTIATGDGNRNPWPQRNTYSRRQSALQQ